MTWQDRPTFGTSYGDQMEAKNKEKTMNIVEDPTDQAATSINTRIPQTQKEKEFL